MDPIARPMPDFVVPGFMKAGTTAISGWLSRGGIKAKAAEKEPDYFSVDDRYALGTDWYLTKVGDPAAGLVGDCSTSYLDPDRARVSSERLQLANPAVRIVVSLRDPVDRAISHVRHDTRLGSRTGVSPDQVAAAISLGSPYVRRSRYAAAIAPYLERFDADQILVVDSSSPAELRWAALTEHLGVAATAFPAADRERSYATGELRSYSTLVGRWSGSRVRSVVSPLLPARLKHRVVDALAKEELPPTPVAETRALIRPEVIDTLAEESARFDELTRGCRRV